MRVGLIASAANRGVMEWSQTVGEWFFEIAQEEMSVRDALVMRDHLQRLCGIVPDLWKYCGKADAALAAVASSI